MEKQQFSSHRSVELLNKRISSFVEGYRQNIALLAQDRDQLNDFLGHYFAGQKHEHLCYIYVNTRFTTAHQFLRNIISCCLNIIGDKHVSLDSILHHAADIFPATAKLARETMKYSGQIPFFKILDVLNMFIEESRRRCVLIIEEFSSLRHIFRNFVKDFSQFIIFQKNCMIILADTQNTVTDKMLSIELNFLFGSFEKINITDSSFAERYTFLRSLLSPDCYSPLFIAYVATICGKNDTYIRHCAEFINSNPVDDEMKCLLHILYKLVFERQTYFFQKFFSKTELLKEHVNDFRILLRILLLVSNGYLRKRDIVSLDFCAPRTMRDKLRKLCELEYLVKLGDMYRVKDDFYAFWLSHVFPFYFDKSVITPTMREQLFYEKLHETFEMFRVDFFKDKIKRILELLCLFQDTTLCVDRNNRVCLPFITKTKIISYPKRKISFLIGEGAKIVFAGVKEDTADDNDVLTYLEKSRVLKNKNVKRIFITLNQFTSSARLIAKQNKLISWDGDELNSLMQVFQKPALIYEPVSAF